MLIDTHCHLQDKQYKDDLNEVLNRAKESDIEKHILIGTSLEDSKKAIDLAETHENSYATVGIYPHEKAPDGDFREKLEKLAKHKKVVAIGECGLDYTKNNNELYNNPEIQKELFRKQIGTAILLDLPLVIHNRDANEDILTELNRYKTTEKLRGVFHCFTQDYDFATRVLNLGFYISLTGIITYPSAKELKTTVAKLPKDRIMLETDSPYLAPQTLRGKRNEPKNVRIIASEMASLWGIPIEEVAKITTENALRLFKLQ